MKKETKIKIIYIVIAFCLITFIISFYSNKTRKVKDNTSNIDKTTEIITEKTTEVTSTESIKEETTEEFKQFAHSNIYVDMIRKDLSIKGNNDSVYCFYYYDLPYIGFYEESLVNKKAIDKINAYLEADYKNWLNGESRLNFYNANSYNYAMDQLNQVLEYQGKEIAERNPHRDTVESKVMFLNENLLSIKQYSYGVGVGPSAMATFGLTFDLKTGEVLSIDKLIDISADELKNKILDYISNHIKEYGNPDNYESNYLPYYEVYAPNENHDFKLGGGSKTVDLNYSYYYDGKYYYIITQEYPRYNVDGILKWNGNKKDNFEEFFRYFTYRRNGLFVTEKI